MKPLALTEPEEVTVRAEFRKLCIARRRKDAEKFKSRIWVSLPDYNLFHRFFRVYGFTGDSRHKYCFSLRLCASARCIDLRF